MLKLGNMLWRIGRTLDIHRQIAWTRDAGFDGIGFHAAAGTPGQWRGVEPSTCPPAERVRLREALAGFAFVEIHAPFAIELRADTLHASLTALAPVLDFAQDVAADVITVHAQLAGVKAAAWRGAPGDLDARAAAAGVVLALEMVDDFAVVAEWDLPRVAVNLDVGHMYVPTNRDRLRHYGGIGALIRTLGPKLAHLHLHDVIGAQDHLEIGTGEVEFPAILAALCDLEHMPTATMEMQPNLVPPAGMRRGLERLRALYAEMRP